METIWQLSLNNPFIIQSLTSYPAAGVSYL
jgi:hypothetical protein